MNDETVTLSRELVDPFANIADHYSDAEDDSFEPWQDAVMHDELRLTLGQFRKLRAALAEPVPPAGGDVEVLGYRIDAEPPSVSGYTLTLNPVAEGKYQIPVVDRAHVTRLQERLEEYEAENLAVRAATQEKDYSIARLRAELREMDDENTRLLNEASRLQAEVENLHNLHQIEQKRAGANAVRANTLQSELAKARETQANNPDVARHLLHALSVLRDHHLYGELPTVCSDVRECLKLVGEPAPNRER